VQHLVIARAVPFASPAETPPLQRDYSLRFPTSAHLAAAGRPILSRAFSVVAAAVGPGELWGEKEERDVTEGEVWEEKDPVLSLCSRTVLIPGFCNAAATAAPTEGNLLRHESSSVVVGASRYTTIAPTLVQFPLPTLPLTFELLSDFSLLKVLGLGYIAKRDEAKQGLVNTWDALNNGELAKMQIALRDLITHGGHEPGGLTALERVIQIFDVLCSGKMTNLSKKNIRRSWAPVVVEGGKNSDLLFLFNAVLSLPACGCVGSAASGSAASGSVASGSVASGSAASGSAAAGSAAAGSAASGSVASGSAASGSAASGSAASGSAAAGSAASGSAASGSAAAGSAAVSAATAAVGAISVAGTTGSMVTAMELEAALALPDSDGSYTGNRVMKRHNVDAAFPHAEVDWVKHVCGLCKKASDACPRGTRYIFGCRPDWPKNVEQGKPKQVSHYRSSAPIEARLTLALLVVFSLAQYPRNVVGSSL
jgi:hypothetical protein